MLRPGIVAMRGSMVFRLRLSMKGVNRPPSELPAAMHEMCAPSCLYSLPLEYAPPPCTPLSPPGLFVVLVCPNAPRCTPPGLVQAESFGCGKISKHEPNGERGRVHIHGQLLPEAGNVGGGLRR